MRWYHWPIAIVPKIVVSIYYLHFLAVN